jgi:hypothetical protein
LKGLNRSLDLRLFITEILNLDRIIKAQILETMVTLIKMEEAVPETSQEVTQMVVAAQGVKDHTVLEVIRVLLEELLDLVMERSLS